MLGLLLFLLYINDLPQHILNAEEVLFSDDTNTLPEKINRVMIQSES
jgi:hypothetical protein